MYTYQFYILYSLEVPKLIPYFIFIFHFNKCSLSNNRARMINNLRDDPIQMIEEK